MCAKGHTLYLPWEMRFLQSYTYVLLNFQYNATNIDNNRLVYCLVLLEKATDPIE